MTNGHREQIQTKRHLLIEAINPEPLVVHLYSNNVLTSEHKQDIQSKPTRISQCDALLDVIESLPDWAYYKLLDCLHATEQHQVVEILYLGKILTLHINTIAMISTLQKLIYSSCQIMFILCFMPKRSI